MPHFETSTETNPIKAFKNNHFRGGVIHLVNISAHKRVTGSSDVE